VLKNENVLTEQLRMKCNIRQQGPMSQGKGDFGVHLRQEIATKIITRFIKSGYKIQLSSLRTEPTAFLRTFF